MSSSYSAPLNSFVSVNLLYLNLLNTSWYLNSASRFSWHLTIALSSFIYLLTFLTIKFCSVPTTSITPNCSIEYVQMICLRHSTLFNQSLCSFSSASTISSYCSFVTFFISAFFTSSDESLVFSIIKFFFAICHLIYFCRCIILCLHIFVCFYRIF